MTYLQTSGIAIINNYIISLFDFIKNNLYTTSVLKPPLKKILDARRGAYNIIHVQYTIYYA